MLRIRYLTADPGILHLEVDGVEQAVRYHRGLGETYFGVTGQVGRVTAWVTRSIAGGSAGMCLTDVVEGRRPRSVECPESSRDRVGRHVPGELSRPDPGLGSQPVSELVVYQEQPESTIRSAWSVASSPVTPSRIDSLNRPLGVRDGGDAHLGGLDDREPPALLDRGQHVDPAR